MVDGLLCPNFIEIVVSVFPIATQNNLKNNIDSNYYCVNVVMCLWLHHSNMKLSIKRVPFL